MYLGIDLGTSGVKAVLVDEGQDVVASAEAALGVSRPRPGWSEQDPEEWWRATLAAVDRLAAEHSLRKVAGIGLSGQMHGATLLDADGDVLRPCILWNDTRAQDECRILEEAFPDLHAVTGNLAMPGFTAPKLLWVQRHEPRVFDRIATILLPKAWLRWRLTGERIEEMSDAAGTSWLDVGARDWSDAALAATGLARSQMPRLVEGSEPAGTLHRALAERWGMERPPVVAGGAGDNAAGAVGLGAIRPGDAFLSLGTSGVLWATTARFAPNPAGAVHAFCHAVPETWHQMGVILSAASALSWLAGLVGTDEASLLAPLGTEAGAPGSVVFLPYLSGERTPHNDADVRGAFFGLEHAADRAAMTVAVLEGVAFALADCRDALAAAGTTIEEADVIGGGARSRLWVSILANALGFPLHRLAGGETGGAFGAARLGRIAATGEAVEDACTRPDRIETVRPDPAIADAWSEGLVRYRRAAGYAKNFAKF